MMAADRDLPQAALPALALVFNAFVWGVSWWPLRSFEAHGLHPLWTTAIVFVIALLAISIGRTEVWRELRRVLLTSQSMAANCAEGSGVCCMRQVCMSSSMAT